MTTFDREVRRFEAELSAGMGRCDIGEAMECATVDGTTKAFALQVEHLNFVKRVSTGDDAPISSQTAALAMEAWRTIWIASDRMIPVPAAGTGPDGEMFYAWNAGRYHLELEIIPGQPAEFFYRDRETGEFWGEDYEVGTPLPAGILSKLTYFR